MNQKTTIIGIAGGTGSGKTTVVKKIVEALPPHYVAVVPLDSYYNDTTGMTDEERKAINFDHPDAFDWKLLIRHVTDLRRGIAVEQPTYSYILSNRLPETIHIEPKPVRRTPHTQHPARHHRPRPHRVDGGREIPERAQAHARAVYRAHQAICRPDYTTRRRKHQGHRHTVQIHRRTGAARQITYAPWANRCRIG